MKLAQIDPFKVEFLTLIQQKGKQMSSDLVFLKCFVLSKVEIGLDLASSLFLLMLIFSCCVKNNRVKKYGNLLPIKWHRKQKPYSLISMRLIYYFNTWHGIVPVFQLCVHMLQISCKSVQIFRNTGTLPCQMMAQVSN